MPNGSDSDSYDLFLSCNSADHKIVEDVAHQLADGGLKKLFLDRWNTLWRPNARKSPKLQQSCGNLCWTRRNGLLATKGGGHRAGPPE
jgi:hypothetical protein